MKKMLSSVLSIFLCTMLFTSGWVVEATEPEIEISENLIQIKIQNEEFMNIKTLEEYTVLVELNLKDEAQIIYMKNGVEKEAELKTVYYVNQEDRYNCLLYCELSIEENSAQYSFFYNEELDTIYLYDEVHQEEIIFTSSLQYEIKRKCREIVKMNAGKIENCYEMAQAIFASQGIEEISFKENEKTSHEFILLDSKVPMVLFKDFTIDSMVPLCGNHGLAYGLYGVEKDGLWGVIDENGMLWLPIESTIVPIVYFDHIHYSLLGSNRYYLNHILGRDNTEYRLCTDGHGLGDYTYYQVEGEAIKKYFYGDDGPGNWMEIDDKELNGQLVLYQLVKETEENANLWTLEESYQMMNKYGVFSEKGKITDPVYDMGVGYTYDLIAVCKNGLWGYVNEEGKEVIPCQYLPVYTYKSNEVAFPAYDGLIAVKNQDGKFGVLDYNGNELLPFEYDYAVIYNKAALVKKGKEWLTIEMFK